MVNPCVVCLGLGVYVHKHIGKEKVSLRTFMVGVEIVVCLDADGLGECG